MVTIFAASEEIGILDDWCLRAWLMHIISRRGTYSLGADREGLMWSFTNGGSGTCV